MSLARFKDLCLDAVDPAALGRFWSPVLGRRWHTQPDGDVELRGRTPEQMIWINRVPEPKTVKHRAHFDVWTLAVADLEALGASVMHVHDRWTVMADPEGGEFCAFVRAEVPANRLAAVVVDSAEPQSIAAWWANVLEVEVADHHGLPLLEQVPGMPFEAMYFVPVPEPKTVKNRVHWDVTVPAVEPLLAAGATLLRAADRQIGWHVLADPEGNEFCAFVDRPAPKDE